MLAEVGDVDDVAAKMMKALQMTEDERASFVQKGYKRAEQFNVTNIVNQYEKLFLATIGKERSSLPQNG